MKVIPIKIAVCDDETKVTELLNVIISDHLMKKDIIFHIDTFNSGHELLKKFVHYDLIFLDIEMMDSNGLDVASDIKKYSEDTKIVFVTNYNNYWSNAFCVHAFDYVVKPISKSSITRVIDDFLLSANNEKDNFIICKSSTGMRFINQKDVYYLIVEARNKICVYTTYGKIIINSNLQDIYSKINKELFFKTRRDCIINLKYVDVLKSNGIIQMTNGDIVPLAQRKKKEFINSLTYSITNISNGAKYEKFV